MITFRINDHRFHFRAAAVVIDQSHLLLHRLEGDTFWALPGGRVEVGEEAAHTIVREFQEELGLSVACGSLLGVGENFFEYAGEPHHELGFYFAVSLPLDAAIRDLQKVHVGVEGDRRLEFKWMPLTDLQSIDFRPTALRESLASGEVPPHFVQRGRACL